MQENFAERHNQVEEKPNIDHLHIGCDRKCGRDVDEHRREHKHNGQVHSHHSLERLENQQIFITF